MPDQTTVDELTADRPCPICGRPHDAAISWCGSAPATVPQAGTPERLFDAPTTLRGSLALDI